MKNNWNDVMELDFSELLEREEYDAASNAIFELARAAYAAGYQRAMLIQSSSAAPSVEPDRKP